MKILDQYKALLSTTDARILEIATKNDPVSFMQQEDDSHVWDRLEFRLDGCNVYLVELVIKFPTGSREPVEANLYLYS
jgi:hypothetical protein